MRKEKWKDIPGYDGAYSASSHGRIRRNFHFYKSKMPSGIIRIAPLCEKILVGSKLSSKGYKRINIKNKTHFVHSLIALTFIGPKQKDLQVNHIDGIKINNHISNLEYITNQQNRNHAVKMNLHPNRSNGYCKINFEDIKKIKTHLKSGLTQKQCANIFNVTQQTVSKVIKIKV